MGRITQPRKPKESKKPRTRDDRELRDEFLRSLNRLGRYLEAYRHGDIDAWQDMATKLDILLSKRPPGSLADRVIHNLSLHPLLTDISKVKQDYQLIDAVKKQFTPEGVKFELFDVSRHKIALADWLNQTLLYVREETPKEILDSIPFVSDGAGCMVKKIPESLQGIPTDVTLASLIEEARDQMGGGHFTPTVRAIMQATESVVIREKGNVLSFHAKCIIAIAEYVVAELEQQWADLQRGSPA